MAGGIKQTLDQRQVQKLSPLQIQTIKLIELPIQELEQKIKKELEENPVLDDNPAPEKDGDERDERDGQEEQDDPKDVSIDEMEDDDSIPAYNLRVNNYGKDDDSRPQFSTFSVRQSFTQSLMEQLGYRNLSRHDHDIAAFLIGSLDSSGYLRRDIDSIVDDLAFRAGIQATPEEVLSMLKVIQEFEPVGVGARDLRECLLLQLEAQKETPTVKYAKTIISDYFQEFSNKHFQKIISKMAISEEDMKAVLAKIVKLNPYPGGQIDDSYSDQAQQILPDFKLDLDEGQQEVCGDNRRSPGYGFQEAEGGRCLGEAEVGECQVVRGGPEAAPQHPRKHHEGDPGLSARLFPGRGRVPPQADGAQGHRREDRL